MIDSHFHLADDAFDEDLAAVVLRARQAGVSTGLCILAAESAAEITRATRVTSLWPTVRFAAGVHPHQAGAFSGDPGRAASIVRQAVETNDRVRAVGEIGLDYHYDFSPRSTQQEVFRLQIELARELDLPIVIHTREAANDTVAILKEVGGGRVRAVFHCFSGDSRMAHEVVEAGCAVSFSGLVTFPRADEVRAAARVVPADRLLVETDAPYLAPVPHRGTRNEPAYVVRVIEALAETRGESIEALTASVTATFESWFRP